MISPLISNSKLHQPGKNTHMLPTTSTLDILTPDTQLADPFAALLARQINGANLSAQDAVPPPISAGSNTGLPLKSSQDQSAAPTNPSGDPVNMLAAILQQISVPDDKGQKFDGNPLTSVSSRKADGREPLQLMVLDPSQKIDLQPITSALKPAKETGQGILLADAGDRLPIQIPAIGAHSSEIVNRNELAPDLPQPTTTTAHAITALPDMSTNNIQNDSPSAIASPLGSNGWADEFSQKITWISTQQSQVAQLHLNPPNLGPLDVTLQISDNQVSAIFTSPHGAVRDAVENALPKLREALADNGVMLGNATVSDQPPRERNMDAFMNQGPNMAARQDASGSAPATEELPQAASQIAPVRRHNGMVDTFA